MDISYALPIGSRGDAMDMGWLVRMYEGVPSLLVNDNLRYG